MQLPPSCLTRKLHSIDVLDIDNQHARATVSLHGGHILSFMPKHDQRERLWLSERAIFDGKQAIRGGVPICWPWFGEHQALREGVGEVKYPAHGYVRKQPWRVIKCEETQEATELSLQPLTSVADGFSGAAQLTLKISVGSRLGIQLVTQNIGTDAFTINCALHTYFAVDNISRCNLLGLQGSYSDKTREHQIFDTPRPYTFIQETDRIHFDKPTNLSIDDGVHISDVSSSGHDSIVVWNPWDKKSSLMADMSPDGYQSMLCVETAITQGHLVPPGQSHSLQQIIG